jgi:hypothetical protein
MSKILERIEREVGIPNLAKILAERLEASDLQSLLLEVYRTRAQRRQPSAVLNYYQTNRFVRPAALSPVRLLEWEHIALAHLPSEFEPIELSPVCPLGTCSTIANVDQNWSVTTVRNTELVSDSTNVLALECASRRRGQLRTRSPSNKAVHLAARHRVVRGQHYADSNLVAHFSLFTLCSAGRDKHAWEFEIRSLTLQIHFYLRALQAFLGNAIPLHVALTDWRPQAHLSDLESRLVSPIQQQFTNITCGFDPERTRGRGYYSNLGFHIYAATPKRLIELADGGTVTWSQRLLSDAKERMVISGIGSERVCGEFDLSRAD